MLEIGKEKVNDYYSIAKVVHQAVKALSETNFDFSHKEWEETPEEIKNSVIRGVIRVFEQPDITPKDLHEEWKREKIEEGWRYGEEKSIERRTHPCIDDYENLPFFERIKDNLIINIAKVFI